MLEESHEEAAIVNEVNDAAGLTDAVHAKHGPSDICSLDACLGRHHGANCGSAHGIVADHEILDGHSCWLSLSSHSSDDARANHISHVPLVCVGFQHDTVVNLRSMRRLMLLLVIGVKAMCHVSGDQEALSDRSEVVGLLGWGWGKSLEDSPSSFHCKV